MDRALKSGVALALRGVLIVAMVVAAGCTRPIESTFASVEQEGWSRGQSVVIELPNSDTLSLCDLRLVARSDSHYNFDSLALTIVVKSPSGQQALFRTTLCADSDVEHTNMREWEQPLISGARLAEEGNYHFRITHSATRKVEGLWALGITRKEITER